MLNTKQSYLKVTDFFWLEEGSIIKFLANVFYFLQAPSFLDDDPATGITALLLLLTMLHTRATSSILYKGH